MSLSNEQKNELKGKGFISMKDNVHFSCRVVVSAGKVNAAQAAKLSDISSAYGQGYLTFTQRLNVQIPWLKLEDLDAVAKELASVGLSVGGTGMRVRPAQICKGTVCKYGLFDTEKIAEQINMRFYDAYYSVKLPSKFKIQVSGCPNNCSKPQFGCIALQGRSIDKVAIFIGGMSGRNTMIGQQITGLFSLPEAMDIIEKSIRFYREQGVPGERFAKMVERMGFAKVEAAITE